MSTGVVGYRVETGLVRNQLKTLTSTFSVVGNGDGTTLTLKDIEVIAGGTVQPSPSNFTLQFMDTLGETAIIDDEELYPPVAECDPDDEDDVIPAQFAYVTPALAEAGNIANGPGWYLKDDYPACLYPMNDYPIPLGVGYCVRSTASGAAKLNYSGQVIRKNIKMGGNRNQLACTGNATPKDLKFKDFTVEAGGTTQPSPSNFTLQFVDTLGETDIIDDEELYPPVAECDPDDEDDVIPAQFSYVTPALAEAGNIANGPGWYLKDDYPACLYPMNEFELPAGFGFCVRSTASGSAKIVIPSPLPVEVKE